MIVALLAAASVAVHTKPQRSAMVYSDTYLFQGELLQFQCTSNGKVCEAVPAIRPRGGPARPAANCVEIGDQNRFCADEKPALALPQPPCPIAGERRPTCITWRLFGSDRVEHKRRGER